MADILQQNGMGNLCNVFEQEKITFDVVGKLSVYKYEQLCVRKRNIGLISKLRYFVNNNTLVTQCKSLLCTDLSIFYIFTNCLGQHL